MFNKLLRRFYLAENMDQWRAFVNMIMDKLPALIKSGVFLVQLSVPSGYYM
jgi:hypothetical protein